MLPKWFQLLSYYSRLLYLHCTKELVYSISYMGHTGLEGYYVRKRLIFVNFEQALLKTSHCLDVQFFPVLLVSLATARKHWLGYFSLPRPPSLPGGHTTSSLLYKTESDEIFVFYIICKEKYLSQCFLAVASETKKMGKI